MPLSTTAQPTLRQSTANTVSAASALIVSRERDTAGAAIRFVVTLTTG